MTGLLPHQLDAGDAVAIAALLDELGGFDRIVVKLSWNKGAGPLAALELGMLNAAFEEKLWRTLTAIEAAAPRLTGSDSITLIGSVTTREGMPGAEGIRAFNAAVKGLVKLRAAELAINAVSPGYVTPSSTMVADDDRQTMFGQIAERLPTRRIDNADHIAQAVVLLATEPDLTSAVIETGGGARLAA